MLRQSWGRVSRVTLSTQQCNVHVTQYHGPSRSQWNVNSTSTNVLDLASNDCIPSGSTCSRGQQQPILGQTPLLVKEHCNAIWLRQLQRGFSTTTDDGDMSITGERDSVRQRANGLRDDAREKRRFAEEKRVEATDVRRAAREQLLEGKQEISDKLDAQADKLDAQADKLVSEARELDAQADKLDAQADLELDPSNEQLQQNLRDAKKLYEDLVRAATAVQGGTPRVVQEPTVSALLQHFNNVNVSQPARRPGPDEIGSFDMLERESAVRDTLNAWGKVKAERHSPHDARNLRHVLVSCGPGMGKTRFMRELCVMSDEQLDSIADGHDDPIMQEFKRGVRILISFNNITEFNRAEESFDSGAGLRILHSYFRPEQRLSLFARELSGRFNVSMLSVDLALDVIQAEADGPEPLPVFLFVDELLRVVPDEPGRLPDLTSQLSELGICLNTKTWFYWMGSSLQRGYHAHTKTASSTRLIEWIELPTLTERGSLAAARAKATAGGCPESIAEALLVECGGHCRSLQFTATICGAERATYQKTELRKDIADLVVERYPLLCRHDFSSIVKMALLQQEVSWTHAVSEYTMEDLASMGVVFNPQIGTSSGLIVPKISMLWLLILSRNIVDRQLQGLIESLCSSSLADWYQFEVFHLRWMCLKQYLLGDDCASALDVYKNGSGELVGWCSEPLRAKMCNNDWTIKKPESHQALSRTEEANVTGMKFGDHARMRDGFPGADAITVYERVDTDRNPIVMTTQNKFSKPKATTELGKRDVEKSINDTRGALWPEDGAFNPPGVAWADQTSLQNIVADTDWIHVVALCRRGTTDILQQQLRDLPQNVLVARAKDIKELYGPSISTMLVAESEEPPSLRRGDAFDETG